MFVDCSKIRIFSNSTLKIFACIFMLIDHIGYHLLPQIIELRLIGRLAFPIFAFLIAEGCKYTKNKFKHFFLIFLIGILYFFFLLFYANMVYGSVFLTFSFSILYIYLLDYFKKIISTSNHKLSMSILSIFIFIISLIPSYFIFDRIVIDYGFLGMLIPVFISLFDLKKHFNYKIIMYMDNLYFKLFILTISLIIYSSNSLFGVTQFYCLLALIPLLLYNEKPGNKKLKYAFYIFYPAHLILIELLYILL